MVLTMSFKNVLVSQPVTFFFFNDTATTEIYTLSLHDALPIWRSRSWDFCSSSSCQNSKPSFTTRSEEHTSELQSRLHLVCRLLLEKKKGVPQQTPEPLQDAPLRPLRCLLPRSPWGNFLAQL